MRPQWRISLFTSFTAGGNKRDPKRGKLEYSLSFCRKCISLNKHTLHNLYMKVDHGIAHITCMTIKTPIILHFVVADIYVRFCQTSYPNPYAYVTLSTLLTVNKKLQWCKQSGHLYEYSSRKLLGQGSKCETKLVFINMFRTYLQLFAIL